MRRGQGRLPAERGADRQRAAPRPGVVLGRDERHEADRQAAVLLADQPRQRPRERRAELQQRRPRRRAGGGADLAEAHDPLVVGHPEHGEPPVVGAVHGPGHPGLEAAVADADLLLAQERGAWVREAVGHRRPRIPAAARAVRPSAAAASGVSPRARPAAAGGGRRRGRPPSGIASALRRVGRGVGRRLRRRPAPRRGSPARASSSALSATVSATRSARSASSLEAQHLAPHVLGRRREDLGGGRRRRVDRDLAGDERQQPVVARLRDLRAGAQDRLGVEGGDALDLRGRVGDGGQRGPAGGALLDAGLGQEHGAPRAMGDRVAHRFGHVRIVDPRADLPTPPIGL